MLPLMVLFVCLAVPALAQETGWEKGWSQMLAAAKKEGSVVLEATPDPAVRTELPARFKQRFGISVEYLTGGGGALLARLRTERQAGIYTVDVFLGGLSTLAALYKEKMIDPVQPALFLPDVLDPSKWKKGRVWFSDPEEKYILRLFNFVSTMFHINTRHVKPEEFNSVKEFLNPKWRGKISAADPTLPGSGGNTAAIFYRQFGEEFVRRLYVDQKPVISTNRRQQADWLARGIYPISLDAASGDVKRMQEEGFPVMTLYSLPDAPGRLSAGSGMVTLLSHAPHPNAARVFVNWLASKEGMEIFSLARLIPTTRNDVEESFLPPEIVPRPGAVYFDAYDWQFSTVETAKIRLRMKELLKK